MPYYVSIILYFSILLPVITACVRVKTIDASYYPFLLILLSGLLHETVSFFLIINGHKNIAVFNIYLLIEATLLLWQFYRWSPARPGGWLLYFLLPALVLAWIAETVYYRGISNRFNSVFIIASSFSYVILCINRMNSLIVTEKTLLLKHPVFLICGGWVIFFSYSILVEAFWMFGLFEDITFENNVYLILEFVNLLVNLIFTLALIWIPSKQKFLLPS